ncbi:MAG: NAD-dependent epimerase/dehydratase family protein, partial [Chitinivibrionales bacterium]|nr:NAD-dependent epimerase/dehydratase family protein [Chitinivibrionales bacterium]MBD3395282.1 NAD-dependent epimerase/dehydratase family protein [Chitinivibrionales bacterium]
YFGLHPDGRLEVIEAHLDRPLLGLPPEIRCMLKQRVECVLHCAADTSFAARHSERVERVNLGGARNLLDVVGGGKRIHYMSTAYAAGVRNGVCREALEDAAVFNNAYERSKYHAEREITDACARLCMPLTIYRPSIVFGESGTGRSLRFNALYFPVRVLLFLRDTLKRDLEERGGRRAAELGVRPNRNGGILMPLSLADNGGAINLVPVDHLVRSVMAIADADARGIFHIVSHERVTVRRLVNFFQRSYGVSGIRTFSGEGPRQPTALDSLVEKQVGPYLPYFSDPREFDDSRAAPILEAAGIGCPEFSEAVFRRCIDYALEQDWGSAVRV